VACIVVAEDNAEHRRLIVEVARRLGHDVVVAEDGRVGVAAVLEHRPELVIADVHMPELDGLQLCRAIRADPELAATPVVLITAYLPPSDPQFRAVDASAVVRKPFTLAELTAAISTHLDGSGPADRPDADTPAGVADDQTDPGPGADGGAARRPFVDALLESLDTGVVACDAEGRLVVFNEALRRFFGAEGKAVPLTEWPARFALRHHDGSQLRAEELPLVRALAGERVHQAGMVAHDRAGRPRWFAVNARPIRDPAGVLLGAVAAVHDITTEHWAQRYQDCKTAVLKVLADSPDTAIAGRQVLEAIASCLGWPYLRLWLVDPAADVLRPAATYTAPGEQPLVIPDSIARGQGLAGGCWRSGELLWLPDVHAADSPLLADVAASSTYQAAGAVPVRSADTTIGVMTFFSHDLQEPEPALVVLLTGVAGNIGAYLEQRRAEELVLQLAATTDAYISLVGHELRTPLTSITSYAELLAESGDDTRLGDVRDLLDVVLRNTASLRCLVERLLDLAALESGHVDLELVPVDLADIVRAAVEAARPAADRRHLTIDTEVPDRLSIAGDADRLRQVVDQLLDNAVKYTPDGGAPINVTLTAHSHHHDSGGDDHPDQSVAVLTITDAGIGIPTDEQPQLLRRLYRASNARHTGIPGAGLGLVTSRAIVERHHGSITLTPAQPTGTTVIVRLPTTGDAGAGRPRNR
jgi:PAS domain S-box-containing protein